MSELDPRVLAAALQQHPQQWNPVLGFLIPLYVQLLAAATQDGGLPDSKVEARDRTQCAWRQALEAFAMLGFEFVPPFGCRAIDSAYSAAQRRLDEAADQAAREEGAK